MGQASSRRQRERLQRDLLPARLSSAHRSAAGLISQLEQRRSPDAGYCAGAMELLEVKKGVLHTFDGEPHEVEGGAYLSPEAYLRTTGELDKLRQQHVESSIATPLLVVGAALLGVAAGFWLARRNDE